MKKLIIKQKTGFSSILPFDIYDERGKLFYSSSFTSKIDKGERLLFNLPVGEYTYDGFFTKLTFPVKHKKIVLPKPERFIPKGNYKILYKPNPNKCTIIYATRQIIFDPLFLEFPKYIRYNIYFHEMGHHLYKTEELADLYAAKKMYEAGFNTTQIGKTSLDTLSENSLERKEFIINKITER